VVANALSQNGASLLSKLVAEHFTIAEVFPLHSPQPKILPLELVVGGNKSCFGYGK